MMGKRAAELLELWRIPRETQRGGSRFAGPSLLEEYRFGHLAAGGLAYGLGEGPPEPWKDAFRWRLGLRGGTASG